MIVCLDVDYRDEAVVTARLVIPLWDSAAPLELVTFRSMGAPPPYVSGAFYRRELPYLLHALAQPFGHAAPSCIVVDGYVWLGPAAPGLGAHLRSALPARPPVIGVAKTPFRGAAPLTREVVRGASKTPLFVSADGIDVDVDVAAAHVRAMHGPHRVPAMLRLVDRACRDAP